VYVGDDGDAHAVTSERSAYGPFRACRETLDDKTY